MFLFDRGSSDHRRTEALVDCHCQNQYVSLSVREIRINLAVDSAQFLWWSKSEKMSIGKTTRHIAWPTRSQRTPIPPTYWYTGSCKPAVSVLIPRLDPTWIFPIVSRKRSTPPQVRIITPVFCPNDSTCTEVVVSPDLQRTGNRILQT